MSVDTLISLRDNIGTVLSQKIAELQKQLRQLETGGWSPSRGKAATTRPGKGGKLPPK